MRFTATMLVLCVGAPSALAQLGWTDPYAKVPDTEASPPPNMWGYAGGANDLYGVDTSAPSAAFIGNDDSGIPAEIEYGGGVIYASDTGNNSQLHSIDPATGLVNSTLIMSFPAEGNVVTSMEFVGGTLYAGLTTEGGGSTYLSTINLSTGDVSVVGGVSAGSPLGGLAWDGTTMYGVTAGGSSGELLTINLGSGAGTSVGLVTLDGRTLGMTALEFGVDGRLYGLPNNSQGNSGHLILLDPSTAVATDLGDLGISDMNALTSVPAPGAIALLATGGLVALRRRRA